MRALAISFERHAGPGVFADAVRAHGVELDDWLASASPDPPGPPHRYDAVLVFGGSMHPDQEERHPWLRRQKTLLGDLLRDQVPVLGVCLGAQLLADAAGARAARASQPEIGWFDVEVTPEGAADPLLGPLAPSFEAFGWHRYAFPLPPGAVPLARTPICLHAYRLGRRSWGVQFHPEVTAAAAEAWIDDYRADGDGAVEGLDLDELRRTTRERIGAWNRLGRDLCGRFIETVG